MKVSGLRRVVCRALWATLLATAVRANITINIFEDGSGNVLFVYSGFLNTAAATETGTGPECGTPNGGLNLNNFTCIGTDVSSQDEFFISATPDNLSLTPMPGAFPADSSSGTAFILGPARSVMSIAPTYVSGNVVSGTSAFAGQTLASMGIDGQMGLIASWNLLTDDEGLGGVPVPALPGGGGNTIELRVEPLGGSAQGDPHFKTWIGQHYEYHGECDLVLVSSEKFANGLGLDIHIRTKIRDDWSYISAAVIRIGEDILEVHSFDKYYLNGVEDAPLPGKFGGFDLHLQKQKRRPTRFIIFTKQGKIEIRVVKYFVGVNVFNPIEEGFGDSVGLMGHYETGVWLMRDGTTVNDPNEFGNEWQVRDHESQLFLQDGTVKWPQKCIMPQPLEEARRRLDEPSITEEMAEEACKHWMKDKDLCIDDVVRTQDLDIAAAGAY